MPTDGQLGPVQLVDADRAAGELVAQALTTGPGVRETQALLALARSAVDQARKPCQWLPAIPSPCADDGCAARGGDCGIGQWCLNLPLAFHPHERLRVAQSQLDQVGWDYQDLRGKLAAGVLESRSAILSGREQVRLLCEQIRQAGEAYTLSNTRLLHNVPGSSIQEVGLNIDAGENAWRSYVEAINNYNKGQLRLLILLGTGKAAK